MQTLDIKPDTTAHGEAITVAYTPASLIFIHVTPSNHAGPNFRLPRITAAIRVRPKHRVRRYQCSAETQRSTARAPVLSPPSLARCSRATLLQQH